MRHNSNSVQTMRSSVNRASKGSRPSAFRRNGGEWIELLHKGDHVHAFIQTSSATTAPGRTHRRSSRTLRSEYTTNTFTKPSMTRLSLTDPVPKGSRSAATGQSAHVLTLGGEWDELLHKDDYVHTFFNDVTFLP